MAEEVYRIEIPVSVEDRSEPALSNVERKVSSFDKTVSRTRQQLDRMNRTRWQLALHVADHATRVLTAIGTRVRAMVGRTYRITVRVLDYATRPLRMIGRMVSSTAGMLGIGLTVGAAAFGLVGMIQTAAQFEQSMANVRAVTNANVQEFDALNKRAKELGASMPFTASQVADAMGYLGMAGFNTQQILDGIGPTLLLASAGQMDLAESADIASNVLSGMRMEVAQLERVVDVMAKTAATSNTNVSQLGNALSYAAPAAADANVSIEQVSAAIGLLSSSGIQGERAGTAMRMMLLQLNNASSPAAKKLKELGLNLWDAQGAFKGIVPFMEQVEQKGLRLADVANAFGTETAGAASILLNTGSAGFEEYVKQLENAQGAAELMASIQEDTLLGSMRKLSSAWEGIAISLGFQAVPAMRAWIDRVTEAISQGNGLAEIVGGKINDVFARLLDIMDSPAWQNANLFGKMKLVWDEIVVKPFEEWWNGGGRERVIEASERIGALMGGTLGSFLMGLFGITADNVDQDASVFVEAGSTAGRSFLAAFLEAFDAGEIAKKAMEAFFNIQPTWLGGNTSNGMGQALVLLLDAWLLTKVAKILKGPYDLTRSITRKRGGGAGPDVPTAGTAASTTRAATTAADATPRTPWYRRLFGGRTAAATTAATVAMSTIPRGPTANIPQNYRPAGARFWDNIPLDRVHSRDEVVRMANAGQLQRYNDLEKAFGGPVAQKTPWWQRLLPKGGGRGMGLVSRTLGRVALPLGIGLDAANIATAAPGQERNRVVGGTVGGWGGFAAGAAGGAALGSVIPGLGTAIGGLIGGIIGGLGGGAIGEWIGGQFDQLGDIARDAWDGVKRIAGDTWNWISDTAPQAIARGIGFAVGYIGDTLFSGEWWSEKWAAVQAWSDESWQSAQETWNNVMTAIGDTIFSGEWWKSKWSAVEGWASSAWESIKGGWNRFWGKVSSAFSEGKEAGQAAAAYANGGFVNRPHLGLVGEAGPEAIIPLSARMRNRGLDLWERAGRMLGVQPYAFGGIVGAAAAPVFAPVAPLGVSSGKGLTINLGGIHISISVDGDGKDVIEAIREHIPEIAEEITDIIGGELDEHTSNSV
jgi:TP901 family phage tail tape measure protein